MQTANANNRSTNIAAWNLATALITTAAAAAEITLRNEARVQKNIVLLGDIADIQSADTRQTRSLAAIELMPAPAPRGRLIIRLVELQDRLAMQGVNLADLQFSGAAQVVVTSTAETAQKQAARRPSRLVIDQSQRSAALAIARYLSEQETDQQDWKVSVELNDAQSQLIAATTDSLAVEGGEAPWLGQQRFKLTAAAAEGPRQIAVTARVGLPPMVVVAIRAVPRGNVIRGGDLQLQRLTGDRLPGDAFQAIGDVAGKEAVRNIAVGQTVGTELVHAPLLVRTGEVVTLFGRNGSIVVKMYAKSHENGSNGDLVVVEPMLERKKGEPGSADGSPERRTLLARVCALHEVEVFAGATATAPDAAPAPNRRAAIDTSNSAE